MDTEVSVGVIAKIAELLGTDEASLRLLISILAGYPLAILHRKYVYGKDANVQHLYCLFMGLAIGFFNFGCDVLHSLGAIVFTYITFVIFGSTSLTVGITFIFNMVYLLVGYYCVGTDNYDINWTMPQCILVLRLIGVAFDYYDGSQPPEKLSSDSKKLGLTERPTFLELSAHSLFPPSFLIGPQFPMKRYQEFVQGKFSDNDPKVPPNSVEAGIKRFLSGLLYLLLFQLLGFFVSDNYLLTDDYDNLGFFKKSLLLGVWGRFTLYKYMSCWMLTEGACILFGISYNGEDKNGVKEWNAITNVHVLLLENATQFTHYIQSFNITTNNWVAHYIYKRLKFLGNRLISQGMVLLFLAIWHGFHSGYYICFAFEFTIVFCEKDVKSFLGNHPKFQFLNHQPWSILFYILLKIYTFVFMGWCLLPFVLLTFERYWKVFSSVYYMGFIFFGLYPVLYGPVLRTLFKTEKRRSHQE